jgi:flagellar hook protein FlgE
MALTSAMLTGFTGIQSNSVGVDVVGDNLANLNTTAFKGQRTLFETLLYRTISEGEGPGEVSGGSLPRQIGTGSGVGSIQRSFTQGGLESTGFPSDLALNGNGFFVVLAPTGEQHFTRDGSFRFDTDQRLVSTDGAPLQGFPVDDNGNITPGTLSDIVIPLGSISNAVATTQVLMDGRLDPSTNRATTGAVLTSQPLMTSAGAATQSTLLTSLVSANGVPLFSAGDILTINATKGGIATQPSTFVVGTTGSTVGDLAQHLEAVLGINTDPQTGGVPGVTMSAGPDPAPGTLVINSNLGVVNAIAMDGTSIINTTGAITAPFLFETITPAVGEGFTTSFGVFDSLGNLVEVRLRFALESKSEDGATWRYYAESTGDTDLSPVLGSGTIAFDPDGRFLGATGTNLSIDRAGVGSTTPVSFALDFSLLAGLATPDGSSEVIMDSQNGTPAGIMQGYRIEQDGRVFGMFSNQTEQVLGQVVVATFINNEGLIAESGNTFVPGPNSGDPTIQAPQTGLAGSVISGALEQGNVEIAREFINLISYSTGIASASRVVRTADQLLQELLLLAR